MTDFIAKAAESLAKVEGELPRIQLAWRAFAIVEEIIDSRGKLSDTMMLALLEGHFMRIKGELAAYDAGRQT